MRNQFYDLMVSTGRTADDIRCPVSRYTVGPSVVTHRTTARFYVYSGHKKGLEVRGQPSPEPVVEPCGNTDVDY